MARKPFPKLCEHKPSGRAYVTDPQTKRQIPMGRYGTPEAQRRYDTWVLGLAARRRQAPDLPPAGSLTVSQLADSFLTWAEEEYRRPDGTLGYEPGAYRVSLGLAHKLYGDLSAASFGPQALRACRDAMVAKGWSRPYVNAQARRLVKAWQWAVGRELLPETCWRALTAVEALRRGRTKAPESKPVKPVAVADVEATLPYLPRRLADLVRVQLLACMRGSEARLLTKGELHEDGLLWLYRPAEHKKADAGRVREIWLGPKAQAVLVPYLAACPSPDSYVFSSTKGTRPYRRASYRKAVERACREATARRAAEGLPPVEWRPRNLRHTGLTLVRHTYGREAAQAVGGHANAATTEIYASPNAELARRAALDLG
jgi:integrase